MKSALSPQKPKVQFERISPCFEKQKPSQLMKSLLGVVLRNREALSAKRPR